MRPIRAGEYQRVNAEYSRQHPQVRWSLRKHFAKIENDPRALNGETCHPTKVPDAQCGSRAPITAQERPSQPSSPPPEARPEGGRAGLRPRLGAPSPQADRLSVTHRHHPAERAEQWSLAPARGRTFASTHAGRFGHASAQGRAHIQADGHDDASSHGNTVRRSSCGASRRRVISRRDVVGWSPWIGRRTR